MADIICIIGSKGGSGKTTLSHMLCYGLGLIGRRAACIMTDSGRDAPASHGLPYVFADGRSAAARGRILSTLREREGWVGVIDGGANAHATDTELHACANLVLLPFRDSQEDLRVVCADLARLPNAYALPSQWPTNPWQYKASVKLLESMPAEFRNRVLAPVFSISSSKLLLQQPQAESLPTPLNNACRAIARYTLNILDSGGAALTEEQTAIGASRRLQQLVEKREHQAPAHA